MASAAPHVKLLRQLAIAKDDYQSGAFDIAWEGGSATIFLVFGQPSHAVFQSGGERLEGQEALDALLFEMPHHFAVSDWRRAMSPLESLTISIDDLTDTVAELAGARSDDTVDDTTLAWLGADDDSPDLGFGLDDFPLLPSGPELWREAEAADVGLAKLLTTLPTALVVLAGRRLRAAGVVHGGELIDAVWVDAEDHARGDTAAMAVLGAQQGTLAGYALESAEVADALPMLWRYPVASRAELAWIDPHAMAAALEADGVSRAVHVDGPVRGVALFHRGRVAAVYSSAAPVPVTSSEALVQLLTQPAGVVHVHQRPERVRPRAAATAAPDGIIATEPAGPSEINDGGNGARWFVDYDQVKHELTQIGLTWLGDRDSTQVTQLIEGTQPTIEDFVATIDAIRILDVTGLDPTDVHSMAREMHQHAAERLCGA
ncbi:MAG: hypothetical protein E6I55_03435 [Chloroflexi bacterium]|nr:MAG: hypothetical protein E6I55_03435 [Chloroflexota bacterium]